MQKFWLLWNSTVGASNSGATLILHLKTKMFHDVFWFGIFLLQLKRIEKFNIQPLYWFYWRVSFGCAEKHFPCMLLREILEMICECWLETDSGPGIWIFSQSWCSSRLAWTVSFSWTGKYFPWILLIASHCSSILSIVNVS
jgi:hypothetical protein